jgi:hypothetical protein
MEYRQFVRLFYGVLVFLLVCGCKTPDPPPVQKDEPVVIKRVGDVVMPLEETAIPLTVRILQRISPVFDIDEISELQVISFGRITLDRGYDDTDPAGWHDNGKKGKIQFENIYTRNIITVLDQTPGEIQKIDIVNGEIILSVSFEKNDENTLSFSSRENDPDGYFYLRYNESSPQSGEETEEETGKEKGILEYSGNNYWVKHGEERPHLLVELSEKDSVRLNPRTLEGRKVR